MKTNPFVAVVFVLVYHHRTTRVQSGRFGLGVGNTIVRTQHGEIRGVSLQLPSEHLPGVQAYFGLVYASLLKGELRFMPPTSPVEKWRGVVVKKDFGAACPQKIPDNDELKKHLPIGRADHYKRLLPFLQKQEEECLNLNVYVPNRVNNETDLLPVIMFIIAESYDVGTGNAYDGSVLAAYGKVVVVTINFRLGILGFMSTGDSNAPGNYALLDQVAALHWIKENIEAFGGNPDDVTILGQGYGGAMVNLLLASPVTLTKGLFKKAIIQSGSALSSWAVVSDPLRFTKELADKLNCSRHWGNSPDLLECFKSRPVMDIVNVDIRAPKYYSAFGPVLDQSVLPRDVRELMSKTDSGFQNTNVLLGVMKNEGFLYFNQQEIEQGVSEHKRDKIVRTFVRNIYQYHRQKIYEILMHHYNDWERPKDPTVIRDNLMELLGDAQYIAPMVELTNQHAGLDANTFFYSFNYPSRTDSYPRWAGGVHGDDMTYVFGAPLADGVDPFVSTYSNGEKMMAEAVMTYWTNFVKTGNPNTPSIQSAVHGKKSANRFQGIQWPKYDSVKQEYLHIGMRPVGRDHYRGNKMALWLDLIPKIHRSDNLDPSFHLLDNYDNETTFDEGTRPLNLKDLLPPTSTTTTSTTTTTTTPASTTTTPTTTTVLLPATTPARRATTRWYHPTRRSRRMHERWNTTRMPYLLPGKDKDSTLSLSVTIAVGCSLLFLNILIFAGVYYQKDRMRTELRMRKRELEKAMEAQTADSDQERMKSSTGPETDTNSSSMTTPPIPPSVSRQIHSQINTYPRHPIPVMPPQAPYHTAPRKSPRHYRGGENAVDEVQRKLRHSSSADSGTDLNHHGNPSTVV